MARKKTSASAKVGKTRSPKTIYAFRIVLEKVTPQVWRQIEVPGSYSFWDLHVAVQDAMGWLDYHLHEFAVPNPATGQLDRIGIPNDEFPIDQPVLPGWELRISDYFTPANRSAAYNYDFGDDWHHTVALERIDPPEPGVTYPRCIAGERACPPEDCGGPLGYKEFLKAISNRRHPQHAELLEWAGGAFDPNAFDPANVQFWDPRLRWKMAFEAFEEV